MIKRTHGEEILEQESQHTRNRECGIINNHPRRVSKEKTFVTYGLKRVSTGDAPNSIKRGEPIKIKVTCNVIVKKTKPRKDKKAKQMPKNSLQVGTTESSSCIVACVCYHYCMQTKRNIFTNRATIGQLAPSLPYSRNDVA